MVKTISLVNHKVGVGKTTSTLNLGKALSMQGKNVLVVEGSTVKHFSIALE